MIFSVIVKLIKNKNQKSHCFVFVPLGEYEEALKVMFTSYYFQVFERYLLKPKLPWKVLRISRMTPIARTSGK